MCMLHGPHSCLLDAERKERTRNSLHCYVVFLGGLVVETRLSTRVSRVNFGWDGPRLAPPMTLYSVDDKVDANCHDYTLAVDHQS